MSRQAEWGVDASVTKCHIKEGSLILNSPKMSRIIWMAHNAANGKRRI